MKILHLADVKVNCSIIYLVGFIRSISKPDAVLTLFYLPNDKSVMKYYRLLLDNYSNKILKITNREQKLTWDLVWSGGWWHRNPNHLSRRWSCYRFWHLGSPRSFCDTTVQGPSFPSVHPLLWLMPKNKIILSDHVSYDKNCLPDCSHFLPVM